MVLYYLSNYKNVTIEMKTFHNLALLFLFYFVYVPYKSTKLYNLFFLQNISHYPYFCSHCFSSLPFSKLYKLSFSVSGNTTYSLKISNVLALLPQIKYDLFHFFLKIYLSETERKRERTHGGGSSRGKGREGPKQTLH